MNYSRRGVGEPLLLLHGIGGTWQIWSPVIELLAQRCEVIAVDLPGYGRSPRSMVNNTTGIQPITDAIESLLDRLDLPTTHVAGNSMGGWVALELGKRGRARTVTALSPAGFYNSVEAGYARFSLWLSARVARRLTPHADRLLGSRFWRTVLFAQSMGRPWRLPADDAVTIMREFGASPGFDADLAEITRHRYLSDSGITVPVTVVWGQRDLLLPPWQGHRAVRVIPGCRLLTLSGIGHIPTFDDPVLMAKILLSASGQP